MKPSFPFYPDDWMNDLGLRTCSLPARAIWMDMICLMHQGQPYGHLANKAGKLTIGFIAGRCGVTTKEVTRAMSELEQHSVYSTTEEGVIFSRRMVRDEKNRIARGQHGSKSQCNPSVPRSKGIHEGIHRLQEVVPSIDPEEVEVKDFKKAEIPKLHSADLNGSTSQRFLDWWEIWSKIRGTFKKSAAAQAYISVVSIQLEEACFSCTSSYLQSLRDRSHGFNPDNFLYEQARDNFEARWPERKKTLDELIEEEG